MDEPNFQHQPVLLNEVLTHLIVEKNGIYIDGTFGRGGHSQAILDQLGPEGRLIVFDKDPEAIFHGKKRFASDKRICFIHDSFAKLQNHVEKMGLAGQISGILFDLGVSSPQLDEAERGFSFLRDGPLDMRMDNTQGETVAQWLKNIKEQALADVLYQYGEERYSRRIARAIIAARNEKPFTRTGELAEVIKIAHPKWEPGKHPATRCFQALRIFINNELQDLKHALDAGLEMLGIHGRLLVISFHSLEDRIVKQFIAHHLKGGDFPPHLPIKQADLNIRLKKIGGIIRPSEREVATNVRARSAILRVTEKLL